jgi:hypothetical protein
LMISPLCLSMIFSENRFPPRNPSAGQAFSGSWML